MELHQHWKVQVYGPFWVALGVVCFLGPTLILPAVGYEFLVGNWIAYPGGLVCVLVGAYGIRESSRPFLLRFDQTGVVWQISDARGAVPWHGVVRFGLEKKPDEPPRAKPKHLTLWLREPLPGAGDPDIQLDGLAGYRLADVSQLAESTAEIVAGLRRYTPALETHTGAPVLPVAAAFAEQFGGQFGGPSGAAPPALGDRRAPAEGECGQCGSTPATFVWLQSIGSIAVFHWTSAHRGWMCRDCALATYRQMSNRTLLACWWGVGIVGGPIVFLANRLRMRSALRLGPPQPTPGVAAPSPMPLNPGKRVLARPGGILGVVMSVILSLLVALVIAAVATS